MSVLSDLLDNGGVRVISSHELGQLAGVHAARVRKDLSSIGTGGTRGLGYDVEYLKARLERDLATVGAPVVMVGSREVGAALAVRADLARRGFPIAAVFEDDQAIVETELGGHSVLSLAELDVGTARLKIRIGIIATASERAEQAGDRLVKAGINAIFNLTTEADQCPPGGCSAHVRHRRGAGSAC